MATVWGEATLPEAQLPPDMMLPEAELQVAGAQEVFSVAHTEMAFYMTSKFLTEKHFKKIHQAMGRCWDRSHSLTTVLKLMEQHGLTVEQAEVEQLQNLEEEDQINALVSKMPNQDDEQFQLFYLQLQLIVTASARIRRALDEGNCQEVQDALDEAEGLSGASHLLRTAVVQAGSEAAAMQERYEVWVQDCGGKMAKLVRGQESAMESMKKLAAAEAKLEAYRFQHREKALRVASKACDNHDRRFLEQCFASWVAQFRLEKQESALSNLHGKRVAQLKSLLTQQKAAHLARVESLVERKVKKEELDLKSTILLLWLDLAKETHELKAHRQKAAELEVAKGQLKSRHLTNAAEMVERRLASGTLGVRLLLWNGWKELLVERRQREEARAKVDAANAELAAQRKALMVTVAMAFMPPDPLVLLGEVFRCWASYPAIAKREAEAERARQEFQEQKQAWAQRSASRGAAALTKVAQYLENSLAGRALLAWRSFQQMEKTMRTFHVKVDAKKQQLQQVQQMFKTFAGQLEIGLKGSSDVFKDVTAPYQSPSRQREREESYSLPQIRPQSRSGMVTSPLSSKGHPTSPSRYAFRQFE